MAATAVSTPAFADVFSGPYVGAQISRDAYEIKAEDVDLGGGATLSFDGLSANGVGGGLYVGYDYALSNAVFFGVEANANLSSASLSADLGGLADAKIRARESFGLSARLGYMLADNTGVYARGGWQSTKFKSSLSDGVDTFTTKTTQDALVYGAGLETRVGAQTSIRVEYLIEDFGSAGLNRDLGLNGIRVDNNKLSLGISYRF
ncbi:outer membrane immunogenic protein [Sphingobium vermicomposti]|uniref:Outer membrane immunogenic protein n=2 Tax=Sphingobium vermicomposti TaxID=529005 RepID=A0A846M0F3_9SPHN|nr:outer membrane immunogenic protein [Sphingobium vermicomposti]